MRFSLAKCDHRCNNLGKWLRIIAGIKSPKWSFQVLARIVRYVCLYVFLFLTERSTAQGQTSVNPRVAPRP